MNRLPPADSRTRARADSRARTRIVGVLMALALAASVLAIGSSPAHGAASTVETPTRLAGADRYATAVAIAEAYVDEARELRAVAVDTVIVTSGRDEHFGYALPVPALSRRHDAPLLLTEPDALPDAVKAFITGNRISTVYVVGDDNVVSARVERDIGALAGVAVYRVGDLGTSYGAAAEIAKLVGPGLAGRAGEFGIKGRTALLATGQAFADALAAGPLAYKGQHPILLTPSAELPGGAYLYLRDHAVEHVIILGGRSAVSTAVENDVTGLGITVDRWQGADRFGTAIDVAKALLGIDTPQSCFRDNGELGLAFAWRSPDAIVSGPLLGELCAPLLLTDLDSVPAAVSEFLRSGDFVQGDRDGKLRLTVFGGTAAVSQRAVDAAVDAAGLDAVGARVMAFEGGCHFTVSFSEPVRWGHNDDIASSVTTGDAENFTSYLFRNRPLPVGSHVRRDAGTGGRATRVTVAIGTALTATGTPADCAEANKLQERDRVGVEGGVIRAFANSARVGRTEHVIADDTTPPALTIRAVAGSRQITVASVEPLRAVAGADLRLVLTRSGADARSANVSFDDPVGKLRFEVDVPEAFGQLKDGDNVSIPADLLADLVGNKNTAARVVVVRDTTQPGVERITVTDPAHFTAAKASLKATADGLDGVDAVLDALVITAKNPGGASGVAGNNWTVEVDQRTSRPGNWRPAQKVSVELSASARRLVIVTLRNTGEATTVAEVQAALKRHSGFGALFDVNDTSDSKRLVDTPTRVPFTGGQSTAVLKVEWTKTVRDCVYGDDGSDAAKQAQQPEPRLIRIDADGDGSDDFALNGVDFGNTPPVKIIAADATDASGDSLEAGCSTDAADGDGTLTARVLAGSSATLPGTQSIAAVRAGTVYDLSGNTNAAQAGIRVARATG